jgi:hypothetical protein
VTHSKMRLHILRAELRKATLFRDFSVSKGRNGPQRGLARGARRTGALVAACVSLVTASSCSQAGNSDPKLVVRSDTVYLLTPVSAGEGGWCISLARDRCAPAVTRDGLIIGESWHGFGPPARSVGVAVTKSTVRYVRVDDGAPVATRSEAALPDGLRAAVVELRGANGARPTAFPRFTALSDAGRQISQTQPLMGLPFRLPVRVWRPPARAPRGPCEIGVRPGSGATVREGVIVPHVTGHAGLAGRPLLSCLGIAYNFGGDLVVASVLVDASQPGATPSAIPGMTPVRGRAGVFQAPSAQGEMVAQRILSGWLVVTRGTGPAQRLAFLSELTLARPPRHQSGDRAGLERRDSGARAVA